MGNELGDRYLLWMIQNLKGTGETVEEKVEVNGESVGLCLASYSDAIGYSGRLNDWIEGKMVKPGIWIQSRDPNPMDCLFMFTKEAISGGNERALIDSLSLALRIIFPPPSYVSNVGQWIERSAITIPEWDPIPNGVVTSNRVFDKSKFRAVVELANRLNLGGKNWYPHFDEVLKIASINETLIEVLALWAFVEGFWHTGSGKSELSQSFMRMLTRDRFPGTTNKDPKVEILKRKFLAQNEIVSARSFSELRNILAHGGNIEVEAKWNTTQWAAIREQRDLLLETVLLALVEYNL